MEIIFISVYHVPEAIWARTCVNAFNPQHDLCGGCHTILLMKKQRHRKVKLTQSPRTSLGTELGWVILGSCPVLSPLHTQGTVVNLCPCDSYVNYVGMIKANLRQLAREAWCVGF